MKYSMTLAHEWLGVSDITIRRGGRVDRNKPTMVPVSIEVLPWHRRPTTFLRSARGTSPSPWKASVQCEAPAGAFSSLRYRFSQLIEKNILLDKIVMPMKTATHSVSAMLLSDAMRFIPRVRWTTSRAAPKWRVASQTKSPVMASFQPPVGWRLMPIATPCGRRGVKSPAFLRDPVLAPHFTAG